MQLAAHQNALLSHGRCGRCAERVPRASIVRRDDCPHCESALRWTGGTVLDELEARAARWRILGYVLVGIASFAAGAIPLLQVAVQLGALLVLHVVVLRRSLLWLPPARRVLARLTIKMFGAMLATIALLINVAVAPLLGISAFVLAAVGPLLTAAYVEGGLVILRQRLRWEAEDKPLRAIEWGLPVVFLGAMFLAVAATAGVVIGTLHVLASADIPSVSEFSTMLLEYAQ
jgi:hypothetical protein